VAEADVAEAAFAAAVAVAEADVAEVEEEAVDVEDKRAFDGEKTDENKAKQHGFEIISDRCRDRYFRLSGYSLTGSITAQKRC
jgi:hypothetical protein